MPSEFLVGPDAQVLAQMQTLSAAVTADPGKYQLTVGDAGAISAAVDAAAVALAEAVNPALRTPVIVAIQGRPDGQCPRPVQAIRGADQVQRRNQ